MWPHGESAVWLNGLKFLIVVTTLRSDSSDSSDTATKIFYMTLQDHGIKGSGDFMEEDSLLYIPTLPKLIAINFVLMDI